jgi:release factor glutamine methyltransferase
VARFSGLWDKRITGVPVQHLIGEWDFYGRPFRVDGRALVPRPETEILLEQALKEAPDARRVLDAGTGSGIIGITYLLEKPQARAVALDISVDALVLARENAARHGVLDRFALVASDWLSAHWRQRDFDEAIADANEAIRLNPNLAAAYATRGAAHGSKGEDGLGAIRQLLATAAAFMAKDGLLVFEIGFGQAEAVRSEILNRPVWRFLKIEPDLEGIPRICLARLESSAERVSRIRKPWTSS